jgi:hypothetical protein
LAAVLRKGAAAVVMSRCAFGEEEPPSERRAAGDRGVRGGTAQPAPDAGSFVEINLVE